MSFIFIMLSYFVIGYSYIVAYCYIVFAVLCCIMLYYAVFCYVFKLYICCVVLLCCYVAYSYNIMLLYYHVVSLHYCFVIALWCWYNVLLLYCYIVAPLCRYVIILYYRVSIFLCVSRFLYSHALQNATRLVCEGLELRKTAANVFIWAEQIKLLHGL